MGEEDLFQAQFIGVLREYVQIPEDTPCREARRRLAEIDAWLQNRKRLLFCGVALDFAEAFSLYTGLPKSSLAFELRLAEFRGLLYRYAQGCPSRPFNCPAEPDHLTGETL